MLPKLGGVGWGRRPGAALLRHQLLPARAAAPAPLLQTQGMQSSSPARQAWDGAVSQEELMLKDQCITVTPADEVVGAASKRDAHRFTPEQPRGRLHRAFSVFLFNSRNELLLQQRAACKVTFPGVWTNTCCSHPLHGQEPPELDSPKAIADGSVPGAKAAAVRKLRHELGIASDALPPRAFTYLTRLHYCAADAVGGGRWGEHEMDYILFARADVSLAPNAEEVQATEWVTHERLRAMMAPDSGLLWSPWFRIIADRFLGAWWADLDATLGAGELQDLGTIHSVLQ